MASYGGYGGYGRLAKAKPKPPTLAQLEERNNRLREENAALRNRVENFDNEDTRNKVSIAQLSGELGSLQMRAQRLEQKNAEEERAFAAFKEKLEVEISTLREERDAWRRRMKGFAEAAAETETELGELDELASQGVQERRQLQAECLSLQQECEDARVELQETRDILRQTGGTVERMVRQKLDLEWELQEQTTKHKVLRSMLEQAGHALTHEADEAHRQRETLAQASKSEIEKEQAHAESFRSQTISDQQELTAIQSEQKRLERERAVHAKELQRVEILKKTFEEEALQEHHTQGGANEVLQMARRRRDELSQQLRKLETESRDNVNKMAEMQGERTKLLLGKAQQQAAKVLGADVPDMPMLRDPVSAAISGGGDLPIGPAGSKPSKPLPIAIPLASAA